MSSAVTGKALVGVSACLLGEEVRYNGAHKLDDFICGELARVVDLRPVCPEVDIGLGVPREPIQLTRSDNGTGTRLVAAESGTDLTAAMESYAEAKVRELDAAGICGYVLKARSPSCGLGSVPIDGAGAGDGLFAATLRKLGGRLPTTEETNLEEAADRGWVGEVRGDHQRLGAACAHDERGRLRQRFWPPTSEHERRAGPGERNR